MAQDTAEKTSPGASLEPRGTRPKGDGAGGLQTEQGSTSIADAVVTKVAGIAAREVDGVYQLGGGAARAVGSVAQRVGIGDSRTQGVSVEVGEREAAVDLTVLIEYGESIPKIAQSVRDNVIRRIEGITGLSVTEVNVAVNDLHFPGDDDDDDQGPARVA
ncbi:MAG: Asp23/Gls24 family envelope stress response protein [Solirubrobacteraceae bacterium]